MKQIELNIGNMVCTRCIEVVQDILKKKGYNIKEIDLGRVLIEVDEREDFLEQIETLLGTRNFHLIKDPDRLLAEKIKLCLQFLVRKDVNEELGYKKLSKYLCESFYKSYDCLSKTFTSYFGFSIERYWIKLKIERAKELIEEKNNSIGEIAYSLGYSSPQNLARLFKKETGIAMTDYKHMNAHMRIPLDKLMHHSLCTPIYE